MEGCCAHANLGLPGSAKPLVHGWQLRLHGYVGVYCQMFRLYRGPVTDQGLFLKSIQQWPYQVRLLFAEYGRALLQNPKGLPCDPHTGSK